MMTDKRIKVIKRTERNPAPTDVNKDHGVSRKRSEETKRDSVTIVTEWVRELRRRKAEEASEGFEGLFGSAA